MLYKEKILVGFKYSDTNPIDQLAADTLLPSYIDGEMLGHIISYSREGNHNEWSLLRYDEGSFFKPHADGKETDLHYGTALLFPPGMIYNGGILTIDGTEIVTSELKQWRLVVLPIGVSHSVSEVTGGTRYVFKMNICVPAWVH